MGDKIELSWFTKRSMSEYLMDFNMVHNLITPIKCINCSFITFNSVQSFQKTHVHKALRTTSRIYSVNMYKSVVHQSGGKLVCLSGSIMLRKSIVISSESMSTRMKYLKWIMSNHHPLSDLILYLFFINHGQYPFFIFICETSSVASFARVVAISFCFSLLTGAWLSRLSKIKNK